MSIRKIFTGIFAIFAVASDSAVAAPSVRQLGAIMQKSAGSDNTVEQQKARAATSVGTKVSPSTKPTKASTTVISAASAPINDSSRLGGVPVVSGKSNKYNSSSNTKTYSASTALVAMEKDFEKLQNDYIAMQNNYTAMQQTMNATAEQIRQEAGQQISAAVQQQQSDLNTMNTNITSSLGQVQSQIAALSQDTVKKVELDTELNKAPTITTMTQTLARKADTTAVESAITTAVTPLATKAELEEVEENAITPTKFDDILKDNTRFKNVETGLATKVTQAEIEEAKTAVRADITNATKDLATKAELEEVEENAITPTKFDDILKDNTRFKSVETGLATKVTQAEIEDAKTAVRADITNATKDLATKAELEEIEENAITPTKFDDILKDNTRFKSVETGLATKVTQAEIEDAKTAVRADITNATKDLATKAELEEVEENAITPTKFDDILKDNTRFKNVETGLATKVTQAEIEDAKTAVRADITNATKDLATKAELEEIEENAITPTKFDDILKDNTRFKNVETGLATKVTQAEIEEAKTAVRDDITNATKDLVSLDTVQDMLDDLEIPEGDGCQTTTYSYTGGREPITVTVGDTTIHGVTVRGYKTTTVTDTCNSSNSQVTVTQDTCHLDKIGVKTTDNIDLYMCMPQNVCAPGASCMGSPYYLVVENGGVGKQIASKLAEKQDTLSAERLAKIDTAQSEQDVNNKLTNLTLSVDKITGLDTTLSDYMKTSDITFAIEGDDLKVTTSKGVQTLGKVVGNNGNDGKSAYDIAKTEGFSGTKTEWLESLKGADGNNGNDGKSAYDIAKTEGFSGTKTEWLESLKGETPVIEVERNNDDLIVKVNGVANNIGNIKGETGAQGMSNYEWWKGLEGNSEKTPEEFLETITGGVDAQTLRDAIDETLRTQSLVTDDSLATTLAGYATTASVPTKLSQLTNDEGYAKGTIPTKLSDLSNDSGFVTTASIPTKLSQLTNDEGYAKGTIPTKLSDLSNDSGFVTTASIPTKLSDLSNDSGFVTTASIPTKLSQLTNDEGYAKGTIPTKLSDLSNDSGFVTTASIPTKLSDLTDDKGYALNSEIPTKLSDLTNDAGYAKGTIPTKLSDLSNDSGFVTTASIPTKLSQLTNDEGYAKGTIPTKLSDLSNDSGFVTTASIPTKLSQLTNDEGYAKGTIPTKLSDLSNDSGFVTTASIPTKLSDLTDDKGYALNSEIPTKLSDLTNDAGYAKGTIPTKLSDLSNDSGFVTTASIPTKLSQLTNDEGYAKGTIPTKLSDLSNDSGFVTTASIPTKLSQLTNDEGYLTSTSTISASNISGRLTAGQMPDMSSTYAPSSLSGTVSTLQNTVGNCTTQEGKTECTGLHQVANSASTAAAAAQSTANSASTAAAAAQSTANSASTAASNAASGVSSLQETVGTCTTQGNRTTCNGLLGNVATVTTNVSTLQSTVQQQANTISQLSATVESLRSQVEQMTDQQTPADK